MKNKQELQEDGAVAAPGNVTAGVEGPKLPIKAKNIFKRVQDLKKKKNQTRERSTSDFL
jgi:hypothetical protein